MAFEAEDWQTKRPTIRERSKFIFNNELLSDIKFVVRESNDQSETSKVIPAHKFVLSISSPVFLAMFYGEMPETRDSVELPDCEYESLLELFRYLYCDEVNLSPSNVMQVWYLAKKYIVPSLADKCSKYLHENLDGSNVFCVLPHVLKFEENDLVDRCWKVVDAQTNEAVKSDEFVTLDRSLVESIVKRDSLQVTEVELFKAVDGWATKECERQGLSPDGSVKRRILDEEIVTAIRFPLMSLKEFASVVLDRDILTKKETADMIKHFSDVPTSSFQFSQTSRGGPPKPCRRFGEYGKSDWRYLNDRVDKIRFSVSKAVNLHGVRIFGSNGNNYTVILYLKEVADDSKLLVNKSGVYPSEKDDTGGYYGFDVLFEVPVLLTANKTYDVVALIKGPPSWCGELGDNSVHCSETGVIFAFSNSDSRNSTSVIRGQFPAFLFSLGSC